MTAHDDEPSADEQVHYALTDLIKLISRWDEESNVASHHALQACALNLRAGMASAPAWLRTQIREIIDGKRLRLDVPS